MIKSVYYICYNEQKDCSKIAKDIVLEMFQYLTVVSEFVRIEQLKSTQ